MQASEVLEKEPSMEQGELTLGELRQWLEEKLYTIGTDVKGIKADLKIFDERLTWIERNIGKVDQIVQKLQTEVTGTKQELRKEWENCRVQYKA